MVPTNTLFEQSYPFETVPELLRWAKKQKLIAKETNRSKLELKEGEYAVPYKNPKKKPKLNIKTGRIKKMPDKKHFITNIKPEDRTLKNIPKYADNKPKVRFQDWLCLKKSPNLYEKLNNYAWGWSPNGKCYGWSHRAVHGFKIGDKVTPDTMGNWKQKEWVIEKEWEVERLAKEFAKDVS